ncbi:MAG: DUF3300 domain-containing protein [Gammaproteobacteria bacterium]|nr:MAG: DUF3300 domain-containing protein [Gammaproteobacteria bacterium]RLA12439.1 MAG: DUF3300 domain-containing protein [Gammaproteobacteria bacterium]
MKKQLATFGKLLIIAAFCLMYGAVQAEETDTAQAKLDQMMAPIALYPDALLAQILMASTYPADVAEAVKWSKENPKQEGDAAVEVVQDKPWDPSVMSLVAFPQVLAMMGEQPDWVQNLGDAFLADSSAVMDTAQALRKKAKDEGNLESSEQQTVIVEEPAAGETTIIIEPANPEVVYVPYYNPTVVYGVWWYPYYTPYYYRPVYYRPGAAIVGFGIGVAATRALWGNPRWGRGDVDINVNRYNNINRNKINSGNRNAGWKHNANNRRGTPYKDKGSRDKFDKKRGGADQRQDFRGRDGQRDQARNNMENRGVNPAEGRRELKGAGGNQARSSVDRANRDARMVRDTSRNRGSGGSLGSGRSGGSGRVGGSGSRQTTSRSHALSGSGNARSSRQSANRGNYSRGSMSRAGGGRMGGGRRGGGGRGRR